LISDSSVENNVPEGTVDRVISMTTVAEDSAINKMLQDTETEKITSLGTETDSSSMGIFPPCVTTTLPPCIEAEKGVILRKGKNLKYVFVTEAKCEKMENFYFFCEGLIGKPFGSAFKVLPNKKVEQINPVDVEENQEEYITVKNGSQSEETRDNRNIVDSSTHQKLSKEEIMSLRGEGKAGDEIIKQLVENSATFEDRTEFSKAKYLKKKKKKYMAHFVALRPTARLLAEMYFFKQPAKILCMRPDTLAQLLTYANIHANSNVLLAETCQGFVTGAILERLGGSAGKITQLHHGNILRAILEQYNYRKNDLKGRLCSFPLESLDDLRRDMTSLSIEELVRLFYAPSKNRDNSTTGSTGEIDERSGEKVGEKRKKLHESSKSIPDTKVTRLTQEEREAEGMMAISSFVAGNFDALVIATKFHPKKILLSTWGFLQQSQPFVVYCQHKEPLMECFVTLKEMGEVAAMELTETWCRGVQVLPNRTHPDIVMSATGGYLLRGLKVEKCVEQE